VKLSARNQFKGAIVEIREGAVNGVVKLDIGGGKIIGSVIKAGIASCLVMAEQMSAYILTDKATFLTFVANDGVMG